MALWRNIWHQLSNPSISIESQYERERVALYSSLIFILTSLFIVITISILIFVPQSIVTNIIFCLISIAYGVLFAMSRTSLYRWSARLFTWISVGIIIYSFLYLAPPNSRHILNYIAVPILITGFLTSRRESFISIAIMILIIFIAEFTHPDYHILLTGPVLLMLIIGTVTIAVTSISQGYYNQAIDNEARYRNLMQANSEGIVIVDKGTARVVDANPAFENMLGYSSAEIINEYPLQFVSADDKKLMLKIWESDSQDSVLELKLTHKQGYSVDVELTMRPYMFLNQSVFVFGVSDISDRKQVEALILESEQRFRSIFDKSSHYFGILDSNGKVLEFNQSTYNKFGFNPETVAGRYLWEFDNWAESPEQKTRSKELIQHAVKGNSIREDLIVLDKDGNSTYLDFSMKAVQGADNQANMIILDSRDTTAYHLADAKRREYEQRYQAIFDHTTDAVFIYTLDGKFLSINKRAEEMVLINSDNIENLSIYDFVATDERKQSKAILSNLLGGVNVSHVPERKMIRSNGELFYAETLGMIVRDNQGNPRYIQSMIRDITERKRQEKLRFDSALQHERTQLLGHFIDNASHYFRTPITNMKTRLYLLPRVLDKPEKRDEQVEVLNLELERLENLLNDLLTVLRLQKDDTEYSFAKIPIKQLLIEVRQSFEGLSNYNDFTWTWEDKDEHAIAIGDKARLSKSLFNLVKNAITYTPVGGDIIIQSFTQDGLIAINVINSGESINEEDLPFVFDDFFRGQDAMEQDSTGTGLGLTITKMITERHQGRIFVTIPARGGTQFQIILPNHVDWTQAAPPLPDTILEHISG